MTSDSLGEELRREVGGGALSELSDGPPGWRVEPLDGEALAGVVRVLNERRGTARVRGSGTHDALGNRVDEPALLLSTQALCGIEELDTQDGVVRVRAGTPLGELRTRVAPHGWELPLGAPDSATVGGTIGAAAIDARRLGYGAPRDCVLGLDVVLATAERTRCGGRVVKNVTGFDLAKLYTGSLGSLCVIEAAWLRLRPRPQTVAVRIARLGVDPGDGREGIGSGRARADRALEAARRTTARCAALVDAGFAADLGLGTASSGAPYLLVEFAGSEPGVANDLHWLEASFDVAEAPPEAIDRLSALQRGEPEHGARARVAVLPSRCAQVLEGLQSTGARVVAHPGLGLVYAEWSASAVALEMLGPLVDRTRGEARFEWLPAAQKRGLDVFGIGSDARARVDRMRALKQQFDPARVLNPGRGLGRV